MNEIPLQSLPRQSLTVTLAEQRWDIRVVLAGHDMYMDFVLDNEPLITGIRALPGVGLLPYRHLVEKAGGNFMFITDDDSNEIPHYSKFADTCSLIWYTTEEVSEL